MNIYKYICIYIFIGEKMFIFYYCCIFYDLGFAQIPSLGKSLFDHCLVRDHLIEELTVVCWQKMIRCTFPKRKNINLWINNRGWVGNHRKLWNARFVASSECPDVFVAKGALQDVILKKCVAELQNLRTDPVLCHGQVVAGVAAGALQVWGAPV